MASLDLKPEELKALEATRNRLLQLSNSIASVKNDVYSNNPLPNPASLQASSHILQQNLSYLLDVMTEHSTLFQRVVVHPSTNYPGRTEESILLQLLRKKLEPDIEGLVEKGRETASAAGIDGSSFVSREAAEAERGPKQRYLDDDDEDVEDDSSEDEGAAQEPLGLGDVWADSREWTMQRLAEFIRDETEDPYTREEREMGVENVRTGLKRNLEEDSDEEEEDEDEEDVTMLDAAPVAPSSAQRPGQPTGVGAGPPHMVPGAEPERMLWFAARGDSNMPAYVELESARQAKAAAANRGGR